MVLKELRTKHGASLKDMTIVLFLAVFGFTTVYLFVAANAIQSGHTVDSQFTQAYERVTARGLELSNFTTTLQNRSQSITEAPPLETAFFGLKGMWAVMRLPFDLIDIAVGASSSMWSLLPFVTNDGTDGATTALVKSTFTSILIAIILFTVVAFFTQRGREP